MISIVLNLLLGISLFLFGLNLMSDHLKKLGATRLEPVLARVTKHPLKGLLLGTGVTAFLQSSSAVCAMVVGLVESSIIRFQQALPLILGSIAGTAVTGWLIAYSSLEINAGILSVFSASVISAVCATGGIILKLFGKKRNVRRVGELLLGFAVLMLGIHLITQAVEPIKGNKALLDWVNRLNFPPLLLCAGLAIAALLQSASASIGILQTFSATGAVGFRSCYFLTLGIGIGASLPVLLSSVGKNKQAKKAALSYLAVNVFGALLGSIIYYIAPIGLLWSDLEMNTITVAALNTAYRIAVVLTAFIFRKQIEKLTGVVFKDKPKVENTAIAK